MTLPATEHPFAQYIRALGKGKKGARSLTQEEACAAMTAILTGQIEEIQLGAFLMLLRVKEEAAEELAGFVTATRQVINAPRISADLDWSSYAGKRKHLPWFLLAAQALADQGIRVFMHGTQGHTAGRLYTPEALAVLGIPTCASWQEVAGALEDRHFAYLPLANFCPPLDRLIHLKPVLGLRSVIHTMARLINPLACPASLQSIFHPAYADKHGEASLLLQQPRMAVIKGDGGEIEIRPEASSRILLLENGALDEEIWDKTLNGRQEEEGIATPDLLLALWRGEAHQEYGTAAVLSTIALALRVLGRATCAREALEQAQDCWRARDRSRL